jgi:hypothetical protein
MLHPQFLKNPPGGGIPPKMRGVDPVQTQTGKCISQDGTACFGTETLAPIRFSDPVPELGPEKPKKNLQSYGPDQLV